MNGEIKYEVKIHNNYIKIYLDDTLHVAIKQSDLIGIHAYKNADCTYCIEYHTPTKMIVCEYNTPEKWKSILKLVDALKL